MTQTLTKPNYDNTKQQMTHTLTKPNYDNTINKNDTIHSQNQTTTNTNNLLYGAK